ncbi:VOC family protein [Winogradskya consettensis]|uniref:VOC family protein n=1 Tax=Winogradskya consettensis TaxID=113560 RepID=UPI001BB41392|nr:VOC family protein [Actinoplanes consettensis]
MVTGPTPEQLASQKRKRDARRAALEQGYARLATPRRGGVVPGGAVAPLSAVPILRCADLDRTIAFYEFLGFASDRLSGYAVFTAGDAELHVSATGTVLDPGGCLVHVSDATVTRAVLAARGVRLLGDLEEDGRPGAGIRSFTVEDPDGNTIRFGSPWS